MTKLITITTLVSFLYFAYMKYFTTHPADVADFVIMMFATMIFGAWMLAALYIAAVLTEEEDKKFSEKSC